MTLTLKNTSINLRQNTHLPYSQRTIRNTTTRPLGVKYDGS